MDAIEIEGSESIEVVAQFDGAIVDVTHIVRDDDADATLTHTRWLLGGGLGALAVAAAVFGCAYGGVALGRAADVIVTVCLAGGTWAILRALDRGAWRGRFAPPRAYTIGPDPRASFAVAAASVPEARFSLVRVDEAGDFVLGLAAGMTGSLTVDGVAAPLEPRLYKLGAGARAWVKAGGATFFVANVPAPRRQAMARGIQWTREVYLGGVALVVAAFVFLLFAIPPSPRSLALDLMSGRRFARFVIVPPAPPPPQMAGPASDTASSGHAARDKAGSLGKPTATRRTGQIKLPGPPSREKVLAAAQALAQSSGIIGILREHDGTHVGSIFGPGSPLGDGASEILLGLKGAEPQDGYGHGLDEAGAGPGGGGDGDKTIGVGPLGTVGFCRGAGCRDGSKAYARSAPTADLSRRAHAPDIVPGAATVRCGVNASCLDKEIVRRVVRMHRNEVRHCYERGLLGRPDLEGRVVTQFTIATTGRVLGSAVSESSLRDQDVEQCIAQAVRRWEFPSSGQLVNVSYPFLLTPPR